MLLARLSLHGKRRAGLVEEEEMEMRRPLHLRFPLCSNETAMSVMLLYDRSRAADWFRRAILILSGQKGSWVLKR